VLQKAWLPILVSWTCLSKGSLRKREAGREIRRISALERAVSSKGENPLPTGLRKGPRQETPKYDSSRCVGHRLTPGKPGDRETWRNETWSGQVGKPVRSFGQRHRERGQERRLRAGEDQRFAGMPARHYFVLQRSESTSSPQEAPALTFVLRKRRGDHRWTQAGASSAATSERILIR